MHPLFLFSDAFLSSPDATDEKGRSLAALFSHHKFEKRDFLCDLQKKNKKNKKPFRLRLTIIISVNFLALLFLTLFLDLLGKM